MNTNVSEFESILDECLSQIAGGFATVWDCLVSYPELANELEPLLLTAEQMRALPRPILSADAKSTIERSLLNTLASSPQMQTRVQIETRRSTAMETVSPMEDKRNVDITILVIEDEEHLAQLLRKRFQSEGYQVLSALDGVQGLQLFQKHHPNLILLDLMMPRMDGWETCRRIRELSDVPIIMLTALGQDLEKVRGLELGADDYITKPFSFIELSARIRAALRRYRYPTTAKAMVEVDKRLTIDRTCPRVIVDGEMIALSPTEFKLINCFLDHVDRVLTHQSLLTQVWGWEYAEETDYLKVYIHHLRKKIEEDPQNPQYILTERGLGYRFQMLHAL